MIAFALLIAPLPMVAASVYINANNSNSSLKQDKSTLSPFPLLMNRVSKLAHGDGLMQQK
ncbi:hypothetical protein SLEP1_g45275 [Rubroshorea leprosula]|uniref:Uncharacterized protein n=1 Tax=Rubroshorea leprosula TaxID=152421 RepID=A0AAV5LK69_9ROSI|nr:hypothetical protein SLEP1_g45275 [Rubroshorea leprosula]